MEESYETFEEELWPPRPDAPPQKPVQQIRRPERNISKEFREEVPPVPVPQQPKSEWKTLPRESSFSKPGSLHKPVSIQNPPLTETPWENVTLNRCLFVAISILVLTSGFQRLHEMFRGRETPEEEEDAGLTVGQSELSHVRQQLSDPSLWEVVFWWLPDLDDDEEDEDEIKRRKSKRASRGLRNKPLPDKKLLKQRDGKLKDRRAKKAADKKNQRQERERGR